MCKGGDLVNHGVQIKSAPRSNKRCAMHKRRKEEEGEGEGEGGERAEEEKEEEGEEKSVGGYEEYNQRIYSRLINAA